ncbi:MAG: hypothetical protein MI724_18335 [Spirochaetales bacterium]|nr:hypothetical protein [Spirochaetales bacterium]
MPTLQVRELPDDVYRGLHDLAERDHRSLAQETVVLLRGAIAGERTPRSRRRSILDALPEIDNAENLPSPEELVREDRER